MTQQEIEELLVRLALMTIKQQLRISALEETLRDREIVSMEQVRQFYAATLESLQIPQGSPGVSTLLDLLRDVQLPEEALTGPDMWVREVPPPDATRKGLKVVPPKKDPEK